MSTYFETHPQRLAQWGRVRRNGAKPSGVVVVHTAESATDFSGADSGAESVARYFTQATRYASYHAVCDADSTVQLVPWVSEAWHDTGTNNHSVGISGAIQCKHWDELGERGERIVKRMAAAAADYAKWLKRTRGITIPARKITRDQSRARVPGFLAHGTSDPGRRSDPGSEFDWGLFFREYKRLMAPPEGDVEPTASKPPASKPTTGSKAWPYVELREDGDFGKITVTALQLMLKDHPERSVRYTGKIDGSFGPMTREALQRWLEWLGKYDGDIDGDIGSMSVRALQAFLVDKGELPGRDYIDGRWGDVTTKALQRYINSQAKAYR